MFGTPCKPLHAGLAAHHAVQAALWAQQGLTSRTDALECSQGFARTLSPDFHPEAALADPKVAAELAGRTPRRSVYVRGRLVNLVP